MRRFVIDLEGESRKEPGEHPVLIVKIQQHWISTSLPQAGVQQSGHCGRLLNLRVGRGVVLARVVGDRQSG